MLINANLRIYIHKNSSYCFLFKKKLINYYIMHCKKTKVIRILLNKKTYTDFVFTTFKYLIKQRTLTTVITEKHNVTHFFCTRFLSTLNSQQLPLAARGLAVSKDQSREFMAVFPDIVRDLTETGKHLDVPEASKWLAKVPVEISITY